MKQTICEKIIAHYAGKDHVSPGDYVVVKDFVGPIGYSFTGSNFLEVFPKSMMNAGLPFAHPENCIVNGDHNVPFKNQADVALARGVKALGKELGVTRIYDREGIGHVVNVEKGDIGPGTLFAHFDPQAMTAGGVCALFTNGGRFGGSIMEAFAMGEMTLRVPETVRIIVDGELPEYVSGRDIWQATLNLIGPDGAAGKVIEYCGTTVDSLPIEQRMILCCNDAFASADGALVGSDAVTQKWFKDNFNRDVCTLCSDPDAEFYATYHIDATKLVPMVTCPPEVYTSKPASELGSIKINQCIMGTCSGGSLTDLRVAASILKGRTIAKDVRFIISPVTQRVYVEAAREGLLTILAEAGARIISPTCDVCIGIQGALGPGEVGLSQQTLNVPGRSGSTEADIYLSGAAVIAASAVTGYITDPSALS